jgi:hypothetical protein
MQPPGFSAETATDPNGSYSFPGLPPGTYELTAQKSGYGGFSATGSLAGRGQSRRVVRLAEQSSSVVADLRLAKGGVIAGRILNEDGDPLSRIRVTAFRRRYLGDRADFVAAGPGAETNDRGEYRLFDLAEGRYYVVASVRNIAVMFGGADTRKATARSRTYLPAYYPGVESVEQAAAVRVAAGQETPGVDMKLRPSAAVTIRGTLSGRNAGGIATVTAVRTDRAGVPGEARHTTASDRAGRFAFSGVTPGPYRVSAQWKDPAGGQVLFGSVEVAAGEDGVDDLAVPLSTGPDLTGTVMLGKEPEARAAEMLPRLKVRCVRIDDQVPYPPAYSSAVDAKGAFTLKGVAPGTYYVYVEGLTGNWHTKRVSQSGVPAPRGRIHVAPAAAGPLEIELSPDGGSIAGVVVDANGEPAPDAYVLLTRNLDDPASAFRFGFQAAQDGGFTRTGLPQGIYRLYVFETFDTSLTDDAETLRRHAAESAEVYLKEGGEKRVKLRLIR